MNADRLLTLYDQIADAPDAIPRLRRFILDLAVRGKLVPQDPNDEPAARALNRDGVAQPRSSNKGKVAARTVSSQPTSNEIWDVPNGWAFLSLETLAGPEGLFTDGDWVESKDQDPSGDVRLVQLADVGTGEYRNRSARFMNSSTAARLNCTYLVPGDILVARMPDPLGRACIFPGDPKPCVTVVDVAVLRIDTSIADHTYVVHAINSPGFARNVEAKAAGTTRSRISRGNLSKLPFPLPPLAEQRRIVAKVDELMALCDRLETARAEREVTRDQLTAASLARLNAPDHDTMQDDARFVLDTLTTLTTRPDQIKQLRQTILNLAVRGKLAPQDPNDEPVTLVLNDRKRPPVADGPFVVPENWAWVAVDSVAHSRLGKMLDKSKNKGTPRRYLRNVNVRWFDFDLSDILEMRFEDSELAEFALRSGDVLICEGGEPGRAAVWDEREENIYFQKAIHRVRFTDLVDPEYFVLALRSSVDDGRLASYFTGTGIKHFTGKGLAAYQFPLPPFAEQRRIVARVNELMGVFGQLESGLIDAIKTRTRLLEALVEEALGRVEAQELGVIA